MATVKRGRLSSLDLLPIEAEEDIAWAFAELRGRKQTQDDIREALNLRLKLKGIAPISPSAFNRAAVRTARMAHRLGEVREMASALATKFEDGGDEDLTLMVSETIKAMIFEMLENAGNLKANPLTAEMMANLAAALSGAERAKKISADTRKMIERDFTKKADAAIEKVGAFKGLSPEAKEAFRRELFGVRNG
ncbi:phage protein Gp27 family protein [Bosea sp. 2KB_26]|uniref:phage protein Gp27 family protein n=1 Tax=Bosea sp. 2KB_26 TaxID=3237475 RepID=UPI003F8E7AA3